MSTFNDLAIELQMAIWELVLPDHGMHWLEIEGLVHEASHVRDSIRFTHQRFPDGNLPETTEDFYRLPMSDEQRTRMEDYRRFSSGTGQGLFFKSLVAVVPSVWGEAGPEKEHSDGDLPEQIAEEVAYTRRCRQLSTYTQVATLLSTCSLSRSIALKYAMKYYPRVWWVYRSKGLLHRPRSLGLWEAQYLKSNESVENGSPYQNLVAEMRPMMDLIVLRLHDQHGRATPMLRQGLYQFSPERKVNGGIFTWFDRVAIEWHPRWATPGPDGRDQFRAHDVKAIMSLMYPDNSQAVMLYWLVDGVPRPNWKRDHPAVVSFAFERWPAAVKPKIARQYTAVREDIKDAFTAECNMKLEFEANGRRYYLVFVVIPWQRWPNLPADFKSSLDGPFIGGEAAWPEPLRAPARFAYDMLTTSDLRCLNSFEHLSFILSWEPI